MVMNDSSFDIDTTIFCIYRGNVFSRRIVTIETETEAFVSFMLLTGAYFCDGAVIDRAYRAREIGEDVLIVGPAAIGDHRLDEGDLPTFELITPLAHRHGRSPLSASRRTPAQKGRQPWLRPWRRRSRGRGRWIRGAGPVRRRRFGGPKEAR